MAVLQTPHTTQVDVSCYHCGEVCPQPALKIEDKPFCCTGCQTVYQVLKDNDLTGFYHLEKQAGTSQRRKKQDSYEWLEDVTIQQKLISYTDDERTIVKLVLPQIHCISCVWLLEHLHQLDQAVLSSRVNFAKREAQIVFNHQALSLVDLMRLLDKIGYPPQLQFEDLQTKNKGPKPQRKAIYQLGVAGFAFGNIMLFSFPEYLGIELTKDGGLPILLGYLNILLTLPVISYCAQDYWRSAYFGLKQRRLSIDVPIALGMTVLFSRSVYEILSHTGAGYLDSLAGLVFFLLIGKWFQQKTFHQLSFERDYQSYFPIAVQRLEEGVEHAVTLDKLAPSDKLIIRYGELIPADALLVSGLAEVDYSFVTGESEPLSRGPGDHLYAGGRQMGGPITIELTKLPEQSYLTELWNDASFDQKDKDQVKASRLVEQISPWFTISIVLIAVATFLYWWPRDQYLAFNASTAVLIIACPCALALAVPFVFGNALRLLGRRHIFLKHNRIIEQLAQIDTTVFDKTGTLTQARQAELEFHGSALSEKDVVMLGSLVRQSNHPLSKSIASKYPGNKELSIKGFVEVAGQGISASIDKRQLSLGRKDFVQNKPVEDHAAAGTWLAIDGKLMGYFRINNPYRTELNQLFSQDKMSHHRYLLSGDDDRDREKLAAYFAVDHLHFRQKPQDKLAFIRELQDQGKKVLMVGDGLNDAGALQQSDVGVVLTENTNNFTPASDAIISATRLADIYQLLRYAKQSVYLVFACFGLAFIYNIIGLTFAVQGALAPVVAAILMPVSSISIAIVGIVGSSLLARKNLPSSLGKKSIN